MDYKHLGRNGERGHLAVTIQLRLGILVRPQNLRGRLICLLKVSAFRLLN